MTAHSSSSGHPDDHGHHEATATAVLEVSGVQWARSRNVAEAVLSRRPGVVGAIPVSPPRPR